jgi:hypothetical protein
VTENQIGKVLRASYPGVMDPELVNALHCIQMLEEELQASFAKHSPRILQDSSVTDGTWFLLGAMKRTNAQAAGFRLMVEAENSPAATALLRMQLDTAMRLNGLRFVGSRNAASAALMNGDKFSNLATADGKTKLRDSALKVMLSAEHPWVGGVYDEASSYVHLTGDHMKSAVGAVIDGRIFFNLGPRDPTNYLNRHLALARAFFMATEIVVDLLYKDLELLGDEEAQAAHASRGDCRPVAYPAS